MVNWEVCIAEIVMIDQLYTAQGLRSALVTAIDAEAYGAYQAMDFDDRMG